VNALNASATLTDIAFAVCSALEQAGEIAVLCGGSAATYYAPEAYQSRDLDFVLRFGVRASDVNAALRPLGYERAPEGLYRHPMIMYTVEFPAGPLSIGSETITKYATERRGDETLYVYTPTDTVRDRFMHYWAWGDQVALRVALDVASAQSREIDVPTIEAWTDRELIAAPAYDRNRRDYFLSELRHILR
jgi:hypothetical protein